MLRQSWVTAIFYDSSTFSLSYFWPSRSSSWKPRRRAAIYAKLSPSVTFGQLVFFSPLANAHITDIRRAISYTLPAFLVGHQNDGQLSNGQAHICTAAAISTFHTLISGHGRPWKPREATHPIAMCQVETWVGQMMWWVIKMPCLSYPLVQRYISYNY